jgi:hypothetical protein
MSSPPRLKNPFGFLRGQSGDDRVLLILELWKSEKPQEYLAYQKLLRDRLGTLINENGMSGGKLMRYRADLPTFVLAVIRNFVPGWVDVAGNLAKLEGWLMGPYKPKEIKKNKPIDWSMYEPDAAPGSDVPAQGPDLSLRDSQERAEEPPSVSPDN